MSTTVEAVFDGEVLRPNSRLRLQPNTTVRLTIESITSKTGEPDPTISSEADFYTPVEYNWVDSLYEVDQALASFGGQSHADR